MVLALVRNEEEAEDVAQETILKAFRHLRTFRADSKFSTWLVSIALNEARSRLGRWKAVAVGSLDDNAEGQGSPHLQIYWREVPCAVVARREIRQLFEEAIMDLPLICREVLIVRDLDELSISEASTALGISISLAKARLHPARIML